MKLSEVRDDLYEAVVALAPPKVTVHRTPPDKIAGSCLVITPGDDYVSTPETFGGDRNVTYDLVAIAKPGRNTTAVDELDRLLDAVLTGLTDRADDIWQESPITGPARIDIAGALYLAATCEIGCSYRPESE